MKKEFLNEKMHSNLPYLDIKHHYQFITFRTHASVDAFVKNLAKQNLPNRQKQILMDEYLDKSIHGAVLNDDVLTLLTIFIK